MNAQPPKATPDEPVVGSIVKTIAILRHLADEPDGRGVNAIARAVSLSPSSCFNILKTLVREGFVDFDQQTKNYSIGAGLGLLARRALGPENVYPLCAPVLEDVAKRYQATVGLLRYISSERLVLLGFAESVSEFRIQMTTGQRLPFLLGADGRCVAAALELPLEVLAAEFKKLRWQNPPTFDQYFDDVKQAKKQGWAIDDGNVMSAITTVAAPVMGKDKRLIYTVNATVFHSQHTEKTLLRIATALKEAAREITSTLKL
jgi:DNA-binding IclR family transcriptional regulator